MRHIMRLIGAVLFGLVAVAAFAVDAARPAVAEERPVETRTEIARHGDRNATVSVSVDGGGTTTLAADVPPPPQAGPWSSSTTTTDKFCFWITYPGGGGYMVCVEITITISTTIPDIDEPAPDHVVAAGTTEPLELCWTERLRSGETATHCVEVTVTLSAGPIS